MSFCRQLWKLSLRKSISILQVHWGQSLISTIALFQLNYASRMYWLQSEHVKNEICAVKYSLQCMMTTYTHLTALFPGIRRWAGTRKVKPIWIWSTRQWVHGSGISWAICKSAPRSRQITMPVPHHSVVFLQARCPSCHLTNSVKALKAQCYAFVLGTCKFQVLVRCHNISSVFIMSGEDQYTWLLIEREIFFINRRHAAHTGNAS